MSNTLRRMVGAGVGLAWAALFAVAVVAAVRFATGYGHSPEERYALAVGAIAAELMAAVGPLTIVYARHHRAWWSLLAALIITAISITFAAAGALGFAAENRLRAFREAAHASAARTDAQDEVDYLKKRRGFVPVARPAAVVRVELDGLRQRKGWAASGGCAHPDAAPGLCSRALALNAELASAEEAEKVEADIATVRTRLAAADSAVGDPQVDTIAVFVGLPPEQVATGLTVLVAAMIHLGSVLGLTIASMLWAAPRGAPPQPVTGPKKPRAQRAAARLPAAPSAPSAPVIPLRSMIHRS